MLLGWCLIYVASTFGVSLSHCLTDLVTLCAMTKTSGAMHVAKITTKRVDKSGQPREYVSHLLRRTYRDGARVKHETLANLTPLPQAAIDAVRASLAGKALVVAGEGLGGDRFVTPRTRRRGPRPGQGTRPAGLAGLGRGGPGHRVGPDHS